MALGGLRKRKDAADRRFTFGVALNDGTMIVRVRDSLFAVPSRTLWEMT